MHYVAGNMHYMEGEAPAAGVSDYQRPMCRTLPVRAFFHGGICNCLFKLASMPETNKNSVDAVVRELLKLVIPLGEDENFFESLPAYFMEDVAAQKSADVKNIRVDNPTGRKLIFDTVHGVKGETHDITLYLESFEHNGGDLKRILPLLADKPPVANTSLFEYTRRCVYVGMSRPKKLLCVAVTGNTYESDRDAFRGWEIIDTRLKQQDSDKHGDS